MSPDQTDPTLAAYRALRPEHVPKRDMQVGAIHTLMPWDSDSGWRWSYDDDHRFCHPDDARNSIERAMRESLWGNDPYRGDNLPHLYAAVFPKEATHAP